VIARGRLTQPTHVIVLENGHELGTRTLTGTQFQTLRWPLANGRPQDNKITIETDGEIAVDGIGYATDRPSAQAHS